MFPRLFFFIFSIPILCMVGALLWMYAPWPSSVHTFASQNCECWIPINWGVRPSHSNLIVAFAPDRKRSFTLEATPLPVSSHLRADDPLFFDMWHKLFITRGYEILSEAKGGFQGQRADFYTLKKTVKGHDLYCYGVHFIAGNFSYGLIIAEKDSDPLQDSDLHGILFSFGLLRN